MGQEDLDDDEQKVAEVASKFVQAATMFHEIGVKRIANEAEREAFLQRCCSEEQARVYEATVHNLQSAYDTWVRNTTIESTDPRLPKLRGHASAALHLLEAVTHLTHFVERHESQSRDEKLVRRIGAIVSRAETRAVTLNHLLFQAAVFLKRGRSLAEEILPSVTNVQVLEIELRDDLILHARPAALIVGIVNRFGTPVELEVAGKTCNAASILDMMVTVGSHPEVRRYIFRGDENPLRDIERLFQAGLGEEGIDTLPPELAYLRPDR
jgi:phosphotransferase system HPr (HPr) family protein